MKEIDEICKVYTRHIDAHWKALIGILERLEGLFERVEKLEKFKKEFE